MSHLEQEISQLVKKILIDLRPDKIINSQNINELYQKLSEYRSDINGQNFISREMAGKLFYLFSTMVVEASFVDYDRNIMEKVFKLRVLLLSIFDDSLLL